MAKHVATTVVTAEMIEAQLRLVADPERAVQAKKFFKTAKGQYGEGDLFLGVTVPVQRKIAREARLMELSQIVQLLHNPYHECRLTAVFVLVQQYAKGDEAGRQALYEAYMSNIECINNWDIVDSSAPYIVGQHIGERYTQVLGNLAVSPSLWERRIAVLACFPAIKAGKLEVPYFIVNILQHDEHDLIQKAVGWMLREMGKHSGQAVLISWLIDGDRYKRLPRTMLRYAIERLPELQRRAFLEGTAFVS